MKFSVTYPLISHPCDPAFLDKANMIRFAQAAERCGFDAIGFTDHPAPTQRWLDAGGHDALDPFAALAFCAAVTERIRLMPHILVLPYRNPFAVAKSIATLDVLSGGRFILATAAGYLRSEYAALGVDFDERNDLFDEALEVLKGVWSTDDFVFRGRHFSAAGQTVNPKPLQRPHPPIWIGGNSAIARARVAVHGQGWAPFPAPRQVARTTKTPPLETTSDLRSCLTDLWRRVEAAGRNRDEIDVHFVCSAGGAPSRPDFDAQAHREGLAELAGLGVTWVGVGTGGSSVAGAIDALERYGAEVIAPERTKTE